MFNRIYLVMACILLLACEGKVMQLEENVQKLDETSKVPKPVWDIDLEKLRKEYVTKYEAKDVRITEPIFYSPGSDYNWWLRIQFLNPEMENKTLTEFGQEVARSAFEHLTNDEDFEKIEVSVTQKKGFIVTFSSSQNAFFYRDSLQVAE